MYVVLNVIEQVTILVEESVNMTEMEVRMKKLKNQVRMKLQVK